MPRFTADGAQVGTGRAHARVGDVRGIVRGARRFAYILFRGGGARTSAYSGGGCRAALPAGRRGCPFTEAKRQDRQVHRACARRRVAFGGMDRGRILCMGIRTGCKLECHRYGRCRHLNEYRCGRVFLGIACGELACVRLFCAARLALVRVCA